MKTISVETFNNVPENYTGIAVNAKGKKQWYLNGRLHRENGPALEWYDGAKYWFFPGKELKENKIEQLLDLGYPTKTAIKLASVS